MFFQEKLNIMLFLMSQFMLIFKSCSRCKIRIEVPVQFINHEKSPGLKRGGVLTLLEEK